MRKLRITEGKKYGENTEKNINAEITENTEDAEGFLLKIKISLKFN